MKKLLLSFGMLLTTGAALISSSAQAQTPVKLAGWYFATLPASTSTTSTPTVIGAESGTQASTATIYANGTNGSSTWSTSATNPQLTSFAGTTLNDDRATPANDFALSPANSSANGQSIVFKLSTTGYQDLVLSYATRGSATGFTSQEWSYSTNGTNFTSFTTITGTNATTYSVKTVDFSTVPALDNQADVYIRLTVTGASAAAGNNRLDNVLFHATATSTSTPLSGSVASQTNVACFGGSTGSATITASGGTGPYTYSWAPSGGTAATASGLAAGTYTVTITDAASATTTVPVTITQPASAVSASISSQINVACNGGATGSATAATTGGTGAYTYSWAPSGGTSATATGLAAGTYTVTATDANGCTDTETVTITQPAALVASIATSTNVSCNGGANGSATASATGGTGAMSYSWSNGQTTATATGLMAGTYTITVTDANGCTDTETVTISQPTAVVASIASSTNVTCNGGANGSATVSATGGTGAMTYAWSNGATTATATGLMAGTYTVTVTDANGCTDTESITITQPAAVVATATSNSPVNTGGTIMLMASGGVSYAWTGPNAFTSTAQNPQINSATTADAGTYMVTVTDANGCTGTASVTVTVNTTTPGVMTMTINSTQPASGTNFTSLAAAASYLNTTGVTMPTVINFASPAGTTYNGMLHLMTIPGSSATNTVTINGNGNIISICSGDPLNRDIVRLDGTDNITLDGLTLNATCGNGWAIHLMNGNENVTLSNNTINLNAANSIYGANMQGIIAANSNTATGAMAGVLNDVTITGNTINNGYNGIRINGNSATWATDITISDNTLNNTVYFGILLSYANNAMVNENMVNMKNVAMNQDVHSIGIQLNYLENGVMVMGNKVTNAGKQALFINYVNMSSTIRGMVANNMLGGGFRYSQPFGLQLNFASYLDVYYNSVNVDFGAGAAFYVANNRSTNLRVLNNSFAYTAGAGRAISAGDANANFMQLDYNNYYSTGQFAYFNKMMRNNLAELQASMEYGTMAHDQNSMAANPMYVSATDLHLMPTSPLANEAMALTSVTTDFDGNTRSGTPTIGADEIIGLPRQAVSAAVGNVYPNPFGSELFVETQAASAVVTLVDMMGRTVYSTTVTSTAGTLRVKPSVEIAQGVYLLQVTQNGVTTQHRVVKQ